ncbi:PKD domain-containing protein [Chitinophaga caseinilytica]|uniref:PKD domain-containing protein n=1 Tax=Chitinophaga caseinilytica TaxID=2267521 RepID=A0ABZ2Z7S3_9BACT
MKAPEKKNLIRLLWALLALPAGASAQQAGFTYTVAPVSQCAPATVTLKNTSTGGAASYLWDFGDGRSSTETDPKVTFNTPGPVSIKLTAYYTAATATATANFTIYPMPVVAFKVDKQKACGTYTATFTDETPGATVRTWDFGDGSAPVTSSAPTVQHTFSKIDTFDVSLTVTNSTGCTQTLRKDDFIMVSAPVITMNSTPQEGCLPFTAAFNASVQAPAGDPVASYSWGFGDNTTASSTTPVITHQYTTAGDFNVTLTVTTQQGCAVMQTFPKQVKTGSKPSNVSFTVSRPDDCAGTMARLLASAVDASRYRWDFGDGSTYEGPENDINHAFRAAGNVTVRMSAGNNGCYTDASPVTVTNTGPVADFRYSRDCGSGGMTYTFTNTSTATTSDTYEWNFDDNSPSVNTIHPTHTFSQPGTYNVRLIVRNAAQTCMSTIYHTIQVFAADYHTGVGSICRNSQVHYGVVQVPHALVRHYDWRFGDGERIVTTDVDIRRMVNTKGVFSDTLIIFYNDAALCPDTIIKKDHLTVMAPEARFATGASACAGQPVQFIQQSVPTPNIPLIGWKWEFGNVATSDKSTPDKPTFNSSGNFPVKLVITDARNCVDSITLNVAINPTPFLNVQASTAKICEGGTSNLQAISNGNVTWEPAWQLSCSNCPTPVASPTEDTSYIATAINTFGCIVKDTLSLRVVPKILLAVSPDTAICAGSSARLRASGAAYYDWAPTVTEGGNTAMPLITPTVTTTYTVTAGNDPACPTETRQVKVTVKPSPTVNAGPDQVLVAGNTVVLEATYSADVVRGEWKPNTWIDCATCPQTVATPRSGIDYAYEVTNGEGCKKSDVMNVRLICDQGNVFLPSGFSPNNDGMNDDFYPRGKGVRSINSFRIYSRSGQEVFSRSNFQMNDPAAGWKGLQNGKLLAPDVYIWLLDAVCDTGERFTLKGNVTLLR